MSKDEEHLLQKEMGELMEHINKALKHLYALGLSPYDGYYEKILKIKEILK